VIAAGLAASTLFAQSLNENENRALTLPADDTWNSGALRLVGDSSIRLGLLLAGGRHAAASEDIAAGVALALAEANERVGGRKIILLREDVSRQNGETVDKARRLIAAGADILIGPARPADVPAIRDLVDAERVPLIVPIPGARNLAALKCSRFVLHLTPAEEQIAAPLGTWIGERKTAKRIYLLAPDESPARETVAAFEKSFVAAGGEIVGEEYVSAPNPDFAPYLAKLRLMDADSVYALFQGEPAGVFARQFESMGLAKRVAVFGPWPVGIQPEKAAVTGAFDYAPSLDTPENRRFREAFSRLFARLPTEHAARGYDAARAAVEALQVTEGRTDDRDALSAILARVWFMWPRGPIRADPRRPSMPERLYIVRAEESSEGTTYEVLDRVTAPISAVSARAVDSRQTATAAELRRTPAGAGVASERSLLYQFRR
jgi:branched-chain amino acid transport system substrate-binding protein